MELAVIALVWIIDVHCRPYWWLTATNYLMSRYVAFRGEHHCHCGLSWCCDRNKVAVVKEDFISGDNIRHKGNMDASMVNGAASDLFLILLTDLIGCVLRRMRGPGMGPSFQRRTCERWRGSHIWLGSKRERQVPRPAVPRKQPRRPSFLTMWHMELNPLR